MMLALPILGVGIAAVLASLARPRIASVVGVIAALAALTVYLTQVSSVAEGLIPTAAFGAVPALGIAGGLRLDGLSLVFVLLITGIGALILLFAEGYLADDPKRKRLVAMLLVFMLAMLGAVTADDVIVLFVFWELTSLTSFLLVGYKHEREASRRAALQALLVTGGGGLVLLAGLILLTMAAGTTSLSGIIAAQSAVLADPLASVAMVLIILGCFTKSAQVPFHFWLPNAMAAPTPVSAYLHSATMVKLGVYLLARLNPLYQEEALWQALLSYGGIATALTGVCLAFRETDLKRVLAYTTVTALGTLVMLIGIAPDLSITAAMTFLVVHAFYKAALFMIAGAIDHAAGTRDASQLRGLGQVMPVTALAAGLAAFSMAGLPPFVGFVAKELIYEAKLEMGSAATGLIVAGFLVNAATVAIAVVLSWRLFAGRQLVAPSGAASPPHDPPLSMMVGPVVLACLGLMAGTLPTVLGAVLIDPAVTAVLGRPADVTLKLWHGFNAVLALSAATVTVGIVLYLLWERLVPRLKAVSLLDRFGPSVGYEHWLAATLRLATRTTTTIQHGSLTGYVRTLVLVMAVACLGMLILRGGVAWPEGGASLDARAGLGGLMLIGLGGTVLARTALQAVLAMGLVGFTTALVFLMFGAPDVAFTQFAVETLLVVILTTALMRLPIQGRDGRSRQQKLGDAGVALLCGVAVAAVLAAVLASPFDPRLSVWFGAESLPAAHGRNVVNVILVDFRALDTLGEITVLAIAAFAVVALLRSNRPPAPTAPSPQGPLA
ncbi:MAG: hydrogen gas-evolving membrane-bound hydrogenase subunit E [Alphaproteobacteria bacterium]|nr:hydrogen gas-evolving membrane-bound hydrogenase subunit E [Alphaproteobacteria bacterium]